ncbi:hypothetical protein B0H11DRAFT_1933215 [Mycena galericulata]|nr:hypothetical protein B0H11DRAFT_1933215 [Mycena galericulata]
MRLEDRQSHVHQNVMESESDITSHEDENERTNGVSHPPSQPQTFRHSHVGFRVVLSASGCRVTDDKEADNIGALRLPHVKLRVKITHMCMPPKCPNSVEKAPFLLWSPKKRERIYRKTCASSLKNSASGRGSIQPMCAALKEKCNREPRRKKCVLKCALTQEKETSKRPQRTAFKKNRGTLGIFELLKANKRDSPGSSAGTDCISGARITGQRRDNRGDTGFWESGVKNGLEQDAPTLGIQVFGGKGHATAVACYATATATRQ